MQLVEHVDLYDILIVFSQDGIGFIRQTLCLALRNFRYTDYIDSSISKIDDMWREIRTLV